MAYFNELRIDNMIYVAPLLCILSFNGTWRAAVDPSSWIEGFYQKKMVLKSKKTKSLKDAKELGNPSLD